MKNFWTIFKKEVLSFVTSPLFYVIAFLATFLLSISFIFGVQNFAQAVSNAMYQMGVAPQMLNIHYAVFLQHLSLVNILFIFFTPALAMRLLAEEKRSHSFELLMTSPVTSWQIVVSKYFSMLVILLVIEVLAFVYILLATRMFEFEILPTILTGIGVFMIGMVYASLSLFASSLTENTMMSFILGIVFNLGIWIFGGFAELVDHPVYKKILEQVSVNQHLVLMIDGVFKTNTLVFFGTFCFFFCFLAERVVESSRWRSS